MKLSALFVFFVLFGLIALLTGVLLGLLGLFDSQRRRVLAVLRNLLNAFLFCGMVGLMLLLALSSAKPRTATAIS
jgi:hypothetical protein